MSIDLNNTKNVDADLNMFDNEHTIKIKESLELKIDWFRHVLLNLEKLDDRYSELTNKIHSNDTNLSSDISALREYIYTELKHLRNDLNNCKDHSHCTFDGVKNKLDNKLEKVRVKIDYEKERMEDKIFTKLNNKLEQLKDKTEKINSSVVSLKIKMAIIGTVSGILGSLILILAQCVFKKYF